MQKILFIFRKKNKSAATSLQNIKLFYTLLYFKQTIEVVSLLLILKHVHLFSLYFIGAEFLVQELKCSYSQVRFLFVHFQIESSFNVEAVVSQ